MNAPKHQSSLSIVCILALTVALSLSVAGQTNGSPAWTAAAPATIQPGTASAVPRLINFNGLIKNADGKPQVGEVKLTFSLYEAQEGGAPLWSETQSVTTDDQGLYSVVLGSTLTDGLPSDLFTTGQPRWLGVLPALDGVTEQARVLLVSMPYALKAADAETLGGKPASAFVQLPPQPGSGTNSLSEPSATATPSQTLEKPQGGAIKTNVDGGGSTGYLPIWTGPSTLGNSNIWQGITSLKVGIGTTNPLTQLQVRGTGTTDIRFGDFACGTNFAGIGFGLTSSPSCTNYSMLGDSTNTYFNRPTGGTMYFREGNATQMQINPGGNVGIGVTAAASTALSVKGNGKNVRIGDFGCGSGFGAIGIGSVTPNCTNYTLLGDGTDTFLNAIVPGTIHFRFNNTDAMTLTTAETFMTSSYGLVTNGFYSALTAEGVMCSVNCFGQTALLINDSSVADNLSYMLVASNSHFGTSCSIDWMGNLLCTGSKSAVVPVDNSSRQVALYAVESPENWFEDFGSGQLSRGVSTIRLEPTFAQTVNTGMEYHVFLTPKGNCKGLYVSSETATSFQVHELGDGTSDVAFDYRIVARRAGYENIRLADKTQQMKQIHRVVAQAVSRHPAHNRTDTMVSQRNQ